MYVGDGKKSSKLIELLMSLTDARLITITTTSIERIKVIHEELSKNNIHSTILHLEQNILDRDESLRRLQVGEAKILITTGVIARGIRLLPDSVTIIYDVPVQRNEFDVMNQSRRTVIPLMKNDFEAVLELTTGMEKDHLVVPAALKQFLFDMSNRVSVTTNNGSCGGEASIDGEGVGAGSVVGLVALEDGMKNVELVDLC